MDRPTVAQISSAISAVHDHAIVPTDPGQRHRLFAALDVLDALRRTEDSNHE